MTRKVAPILAVALTLGAFLALEAPSASALSKHAFSTSFHGSGSGTLGEPADVAVDQETGDVYVTDPNYARVEKFGPVGEFILAFGYQVNGTTGGNVCTAESGDECQSGTPGTAAGAFTNPDYVAVDNSGIPGEQGDVYVGDGGTEGTSNVQKYGPQGELITSWGDGGRTDGSGSISGHSFNGIFERGVSGLAVRSRGDLLVYAETGIFEYSPEGILLDNFEPGGSPDGTNLSTGLAVDNAGNLYFVNLLAGSVFKLHASGQFAGEVFGSAEGEPTRLGIDSATGEAYVTLANGKVAQFPASCDLPASSCTPGDTFGSGSLSRPEGIAVDSATGTVYVADSKHKRVAVFTAVPYLPSASASAAPLSSSSESLKGLVDRAGAGEITGCGFEYTPSAAFNAAYTLTISGATGGTYWLALTAYGQTLGIPYDATAEEVQTMLVTRAGAGNVTVNGPAGGPFTVEFMGNYAERHVSLLVDGSKLTPSGATVTATPIREGGDGWGSATAVPCSPSTPYTSPTPTQVSAEAGGLDAGTDYHYRLKAENAVGADTSYEQVFTTLPARPLVEAESVSEVHADTATIHATIAPGGGEDAYHTSYYVEYIDLAAFEHNEAEGADGFLGAATSSVHSAGSAKSSTKLSTPLDELPSGTVFRYRIVAENECELGSVCKTIGATRTFATLPFLKEPNEPCPNSHVRQQTGAASLLDCRAYELASAANTAGYDVESNLVPGQDPFASYPGAVDRVLYGVHDGGIPGTGQPTNRGVDPYVAVRGPEGWTTKYVGIPADGTSSTSPFGSPLLEADEALDTFAFGGNGLCSPCFPDGSTGIPVTHLGKEGLTQGMVGPEEPGPSATSDGFVARHLSSNGEHLIFASTERFAPGGNAGTGDVSIYDRDLATGETHVVSNAPGAEDFPVPLSCLQGAGKCDRAEGDENGIAELATSSDGSHILIGQKVSTDAAGNPYWHLYMEIGDAVRSIDLTPGVVSEPGGPGLTEGVLFDGMNAGGTKVFFSTKDSLLGGEDTDQSADLYEAEVTGGSVSLRLVSVKQDGPSNSDACDPVANSTGPHWNTVGSDANCGVVAIGGGGGVAPSSGAVYFLSPEELTEAAPCGVSCAAGPTENEPNLYVARPGEAPRFVATLSPNDPLVVDSVSEADARHTADFQLSRDGAYAAFPSRLELLPESESAGYAEIYRFEVGSGQLACASCSPTGEPSTASASLAEDGLSLTDAGAVFFTTSARLAAADTDGVGDVYEWEPNGTGTCEPSSNSYSPRSGDCLALVSAGTSTVSSGLLGVSFDGTDAFFFTRDTLVRQDKNGPTMKIYDARVEGGFPYSPPPAGCKASDECHGPASSPPPPLERGTESGTPHNYEPAAKPRPCKKDMVRRHGTCVKKQHGHRKHSKRKHDHRRGGTR